MADQTFKLVLWLVGDERKLLMVFGRGAHGD